MKYGKKIGIWLLVFGIMISGFSFWGRQVQAASTANFSVSGGGTVTQGNTVTLTVSVSGSETMSYAKVSLNYDAKILEYQSGADNGGSGRVSVLFDCGEGAKSASRSITFKAIATGKASVSLDTAEATTMGNASVLPEMMTAKVGGGASVTVEAPKTASGDAHIGWMDISPGKLNPEFNPDVFKYTAEVENNVKQVTVSALASHSAAKITSVSGGNNLKVGANTVTVICTAENGGTVAYTITVTRKEAAQTEEPEKPEEEKPKEEEPKTEGELTCELNGVTYYIGQEFKKKDIPEGFEEADLLYQGQTVKGAQFTKNNEIQLLYLLNSEKKNGQFLMYHPATGQMEEILKLSFYEGAYLLLFDPVKYGSAMPAGLTAAQFSIDDRELTGYQLEGLKAGIGTSEPDSEATWESISAPPENFVLVFGMNQEGEIGWYTYDTQFKTLQRFVLFEAEEAEEEAVEALGEPEAQPQTQGNEKKLKDTIKAYQIVLLGAAAIILLLIVLSVLLAIKGRRDKKAEEDHTDGEENDFRYVEVTKKEITLPLDQEEISEAAEASRSLDSDEKPAAKEKPAKKEKPSAKEKAAEKEKPVTKETEAVKEKPASKEPKLTGETGDLGLEIFDLDDL